MAEADYSDEMTAADIKVGRRGRSKQGRRCRRAAARWSKHTDQCARAQNGLARETPALLLHHCLLESPAASQVLPCRCPPQAALLDSLFGTERGLAARSEVRAEINELITQLEAKNPTPSPTEVRAAQLQRRAAAEAAAGGGGAARLALWRGIHAALAP